MLVLSLAFAGWAFWRSRQTPAPPPVTVAQVPTQTAPPPPPLTYSCPLDGSQQTNKANTLNRPIVVQIDNAPDARPQWGLSQADIVYEEMAEGQITRFSAIFACHDASTVGPVRSARMIDLELAPEYGALLSDSGSSQGVTANLDAAPDIPNITDSTFPTAYHRTTDRYAPHNLITSTAGIRKAVAAAGVPTQANLEGPQFKTDSPGPATVKTIKVDYSPWADISYTYDQASNSWLRFNGGKADTDALTGKQIAPKNVIIQYVQVLDSGIVEDASGEHGLQFTLTGSGKVQIFRDGQVLSGQWQRQSKGAITSYIDANGNPIPLDVGQTWIEVVPTDFQASWG